MAILKARRVPSCGKGVIHNGLFDGGLVQGSGVTAQLLMEGRIAVMTEKQEWLDSQAASSSAAPERSATAAEYPLDQGLSRGFYSPFGFFATRRYLCTRPAASPLFLVMSPASAVRNSGRQTENPGSSPLDDEEKTTNRTRQKIKSSKASSRISKPASQKPLSAPARFASGNGGSGSGRTASISSFHSHSPPAG